MNTSNGPRLMFEHEHAVEPVAKTENGASDRSGAPFSVLHVVQFLP